MSPHKFRRRDGPPYEQRHAVQAKKCCPLIGLVPECRVLRARLNNTISGGQDPALLTMTTTTTSVVTSKILLLITTSVLTCVFVVDPFFGVTEKNEWYESTYSGIKFHLLVTISSSVKDRFTVNFLHKFSTDDICPLERDSL